jgi:hypothetical protein
MNNSNVVEWDGQAEVRKLIEKHTELRKVYERVGYHHWDEQELVGLANDTRSLLKNEEVNEGLAQHQILDLELFNRRLDSLESILRKPSILEVQQAREPLLATLQQIRDDIKKDESNIRYGVDALVDQIQDISGLRYNYRLEENKRHLDDLLFDILFLEHHYKPETDNFREASHDVASKYLKSRWMFTPWLTSRMLTNLLRGDLFLGKPKFYSAKFYYTMLAINIGIYLLFYYGFQWIALAILFLTGWISAQIVQDGIQHLFFLRRYSAIQPIYGELFLDSYDSEEVVRRLHQLERRKIFVPSVIYSLLRVADSNGEDQRNITSGNGN